MAYENENKQTVVGVIPLSNFVEVRVAKLENASGDLEAIDIRQWYCTQKDPEYKPNYKGVRLKAEQIDDLLSAIEKCRE